MKIVIDIPEEFESHFNDDRLGDSLARIASDIKAPCFDTPLAGKYEYETVKMLKEAFQYATVIKKGCEYVQLSTSGVNDDDVANILNKINDALEDTKYIVVGYDNIQDFLSVLIDSEEER